MAHLVVSTFKNLPVFFNVGSPVGRGCANVQEDVELVTFLLKQLGTMAFVDPTGKAKIAAMKQGVADAALGQCIDWVETRFDCRPDGHISVAAANTTYVQNGPQAFMICRLNYLVGQANPAAWPRLDKLPGAPGSMTALVARELLCT